MNYGTLIYHNRRWVLTGLPPHAIMRLKQIFPKIPKEAPCPYMFKDTLENAVDLSWFESRYPLDMSDVDRMTLANMARLHTSQRVAMEKVIVGEHVQQLEPKMRACDPVTGRPNELRDSQRTAVSLLAQSRRLLLADDVGLGKTWSGCGSLLIPGALPAAIVCWPHLQRQWKTVIERFTTLKVVEISKTKVDKVPGADVYIFRYTQLAGWADHFETLKLRTVIYDEVQDLRHGSDTGKGRGALRLTQGCTFSMGLSATPIYNYGTEIWNIMQFIDPDLLGPYDDFMREWAPGGHIKDPDALASYMKESGRFLRRTKKDVGQEAEPVNKVVQEIAFDEKTMKDAEALARQLALTASTGAFTERGRAAMELDARMRQATGISKAKGIASFIHILVESGQKVLVGLWHREVYAIIMKELHDLRPQMYTGSESLPQKREAIDNFKKPFDDGGSDILLMSIRSGAGVDGLQHVCSTVIIGELDWSPGVHHQFIGRLDREGQEEPVNAFYLTVPEGSDPVLMEVNGVKAAEAAAIIDSGLGVQQVHSDSSVIQKLVQHYLKR